MDPAQVTENKKTYDNPEQSSEEQTVQHSVQSQKTASDLQKIIDCWETLPEHIKAAIKVLIQADSKEAQ